MREVILACKRHTQEMRPFDTRLLTPPPAWHIAKFKDKPECHRVGGQQTLLIGNTTQLQGEQGKGRVVRERQLLAHIMRHAKHFWLTRIWRHFNGVLTTSRRPRVNCSPHTYLSLSLSLQSLHPHSCCVLPLLTVGRRDGATEAALGATADGYGHLAFASRTERSVQGASVLLAVHNCPKDKRGGQPAAKHKKESID